MLGSTHMAKTRCFDRGIYPRGDYLVHVANKQQVGVRAGFDM